MPQDNNLMSTNSNSYKSIMKGTAIFGGTQFFAILVNLIRGKLVALFLGPEGMGISSLMMSSMNTIQQFSSLGLNLSIVKEISKAKETGKEEKLLLVISIARALLRITAIIGALFTILFSRFLSNITFGNVDYYWYFILLSIAVFFTTMSNGELSILQGYRAIKKLAYASIIGSFTGLFVGVPLYYWFGYDAIVPAMIVLSLVNFLFYRYTSYKLTIKSIIFKWKEHSPLIKKMLLLGITLMIVSLLGTLANYILNTYIGRYGSLNDVGMYQAANSITNQYIGIVFTAMGLDYFPRLAAISQDNVKVKEMVNQQIEVVLFLMAPLCCFLILLAPLVIEVLLTKEFMGIISLIRWMGIGLFFKAFAFPLGYISFAKGDRKTFFWLEGVMGNLMSLVLGMISYFIWGLMGMGISLCITYILWGGLYNIITKRLYEFELSTNTYKILAVLIIFISLTFLFSFLNDTFFSYVFMGLSTFMCSLFCLFHLNKRLKFIRLKNK